MIDDLNKKMIFISGSRQSGKTTLSKNISKIAVSGYSQIHYLTWDSAEDNEVKTFEMIGHPRKSLYDFQNLSFRSV